MAVETVDNSRVAIQIPQGTIIKVVSGPKDGDRMVDVLWNSRVLMMFSIDVKQRGEEVSETAK